MTKSLIALAFACVCGMLMVAVPEVAQSQQNVTITGCSNPQFNPTTFTLSCGSGGTGVPSCTISGSANGTTGVVDTLTANCSPAATSWSWTGGSCAGVTTQTCAANESSPGAVQYTVTGTNATGPGSASPAFTVTWFSTSGPPTGCTIAPASQSLGSSGGAITPLVVTCAGGAPLTSFTWTATGAGCNANFTPSSTKTQNDTVPANTSTTNPAVCTYKASVDNGSGTPAAPTATVTVAAKVSTTGIDCKSSPQAASLGITGNTTVIQIPWSVDTGNTLLTGNGTIPAQHSGMAVVGVIKVPDTVPAITTTGWADLHEYGSVPTNRLMTVSQTPCTWGKPLDGTTYTSFNLDPNFYFSTAPNPNAITMAPGSTWYVNIVMQDPNKIPPKGNQCGLTTDPCNFVIEFRKPNGT